MSAFLFIDLLIDRKDVEVFLVNLETSAEHEKDQQPVSFLFSF
jgi:hypothetical protein